MVFALAGDSTMTSDLDNYFSCSIYSKANTNWSWGQIRVGSWLLAFGSRLSIFRPRLKRYPPLRFAPCSQILASKAVMQASFESWLALEITLDGLLVASNRNRGRAADGNPIHLPIPSRCEQIARVQRWFDVRILRPGWRRSKLP